MVVGAHGNDGNGSTSRNVHINSHIISSWLNVCEDIDRESTGDQSRRYIPIYSDFKTVAVGADRNNDNGEIYKHVRVYGHIGNYWVQVGKYIYEENDNYWSVYFFAIYSNGKTVAILANVNGKNGSYSVYVQFHVHIKNYWVQVGKDIYRYSSGDYLGHYIAIFSDGNNVAVGTYENGSASGNVHFNDHIGNYWVQVGKDIER